MYQKMKRKKPRNLHEMSAEFFSTFSFIKNHSEMKEKSP